MNTKNWQEIGEQMYKLETGSISCIWQAGFVNMYGARKLTSQELSKISESVIELETEITHSSYWAQ
jgi:hypothetical protein